MAKVDRIVLVCAPEAVTRSNALLTGQVDLIETPAPDIVPRLRQSGARIMENITPHVWNYHLSLLEGSPWRDIRLRQAANLAIDRAGVVALMNGLAKPAVGVVDPSSLWFGNPSFKIRHDPAEARRLLSAAGFTPRNPLRTKFIVATGGSGQMLSMPINEFIQQSWREVGIEVEFVPVELEVLYTCWRQGAAGELARNNNVTANNVAYVTSDPLYALIRFFHSNQIAPTGVNWSHYRDAEMDRLMAKVHEKAVDEALLVYVVHDTNPRAWAQCARLYPGAALVSGFDDAFLKRVAYRTRGLAAAAHE